MLPQAVAVREYDNRYIQNNLIQRYTYTGKLYKVPPRKWTTKVFRCFFSNRLNFNLKFYIFIY